MRDPDYKIWRCADGRTIHVEQMTKHHVWNSILMLRHKLVTFNEKHAHLCPFEGPCPDCDNARDVRAKTEGWLETFRVELMRRGFAPEPDFAELERVNNAYNKTLVGTYEDWIKDDFS